MHGARMDPYLESQNTRLTWPVFACRALSMTFLVLTCLPVHPDLSAVIYGFSCGCMHLCTCICLRIMLTSHIMSTVLSMFAFGRYMGYWDVSEFVLSLHITSALVGIRRNQDVGEFVLSPFGKHLQMPRSWWLCTELDRPLCLHWLHLHVI